MPNEQQLGELLQRVIESQVSHPNSGSEIKNSLLKDEDKTAYLFKVRVDIETSLREMCEKIGHTEKMPIVRMVQVIVIYAKIYGGIPSCVR